MSNLFENASKKDLKNQPLAYRMSPRNLDEYIGQSHIVGQGRLLRRAIQADRLSSVIFYGPPGTGKTALARVIANTTKSHFASINAVLSGVPILRQEIDKAKERLDLYGIRTILFVDEVHRWNKSQQDALLPWVENGTFILIGATTENPFFEVNAALVSRSRIFQLKSLTKEDLYKIAFQAIKDENRGYGKYEIEFEENSLEHLVEVASGDARSLLNALELAIETSDKKERPDKKPYIYIDKDTAEQSIQQKAVLYDKEGDYHFDVISAFIKSIRGSDPDAALYWLAKMVHAGEDPKFIFRRMMISATEDVGLADPQAIVVVTSDANAFNMIGLPEGRFHLAHAALYLAVAPKSNSTLGFFDALKTVEEDALAEVPNHLRDASRDAKSFGHGKGYMYPHAYKDHWVAQQYLPNSLQGKIFYNCGSTGFERKISEEVSKKREIQLEANNQDNFVENLTFSFDDNTRMAWINRTVTERSELLEELRNEVFSILQFSRNDRVLVLNAGFGLFVFASYRRTPEGLVVAQVNTKEQFEHLQHYNGNLEEIDKIKIIKDLNELDEDLRFERIIVRNSFSSFFEDPKKLENLILLMGKNSQLLLVDTIAQEGTRLSDLVETLDLKKALKKAESFIYNKENQKNSILKWDAEDMKDTLSILAANKSGISFDLKLKSYKEKRYASEEDIKRWVIKSYYPIIEEKNIFDCSEEGLIKDLVELLADKVLIWNHRIAFVNILLS
ncbi:MAG: AAA family ATPase [Sphaerochaetaceae bacterium]